MTSATLDMIPKIKMTSDATIKYAIRLTTHQHANYYRVMDMDAKPHTCHFIVVKGLISINGDLNQICIQASSYVHFHLRSYILYGQMSSMIIGRNRGQSFRKETNSVRLAADLFTLRNM